MALASMPFADQVTSPPMSTFMEVVQPVGPVPMEGMQLVAGQLRVSAATSVGIVDAARLADVCRRRIEVFHSAVPLGEPSLSTILQFLTSRRFLSIVVDVIGDTFFPAIVPGRRPRCR